MSTPEATYGLLAEFGSADALLEAARAARQAGYKEMDAYAPFPVEGLAEAVGMRTNRVPLLVFGGGLLGAGLAYFMQWYANVIDYPINVGGRPLHSWPSFIPITFELGILFAAFGAFIAVLALNRLPRLRHPVFESARFERASRDRFFLCLEATDERFEMSSTHEFLQSLDPLSVERIPSDGRGGRDGR